MPSWKLTVLPDSSREGRHWVSFRKFGDEAGEFTRPRRVRNEDALLSLLSELRPAYFGESERWIISGEMPKTVLAATEYDPEQVIERIQAELDGTLAINAALTTEADAIAKALDAWTDPPALEAGTPTIGPT